jgi:glycosyltransferase involved in cell wall biosynthesis
VKTGDDGPAVSVCVPTLNRARYLSVTISSVLDQTFQDYELIVCDNGSTDETPHVVRAFRDARIRYLRSPDTVGMGANWRRALEAARGRYCGILADDDSWAPSLLEALITPLEEDARVDVAFCDHWIMDAEGGVLENETDECSRGYGRAGLRPGLHLPFLALALQRPAIGHGAALFRRPRALDTDAIDPRANTVVDFYLFAKLALGGGGAFYVPSRLAYVRRHGGSSLATSGAQIWADLGWVCSRLSQDVPPGPMARVIRDRWAGASIREGISLCRQGRYLGGLRAAGRGLRLSGLRAPFRRDSTR